MREREREREERLKMNDTRPPFVLLLFLFFAVIFQLSPIKGDRPPLPFTLYLSGHENSLFRLRFPFTLRGP